MSYGREGEWVALSHRVAPGDRLKARVLDVQRWGLYLDVEMQFPGFMDSLQVGEHIERYSIGQEIDVVVIELAEYNHQIRVGPAEPSS
jgi:ribosomal protein S1